jgi:glycosyltransferase involved in cell wall biosynthesis
MPWRIAQLAPPFETVPPARYGGTERVVSTLTEELVRRGHDVTLFAPGGSRTSARLVPTVETALWRATPPSDDFGAHRERIFGAIRRRLGDFDVVHSHLDAVGFGLAAASRPPFVTTVHGAVDAPAFAPAYRAFASLPLVSISDAQRTPLRTANWVATVHHGIDLHAYTFNPRPGEYLALLGRISPQKGVDAAIRVARRAGLPIKIAARPPLRFSHNPEFQRDRAYFESRVQPLLREPGVELIGEIGGADKDAFLGNARALLFPIRWREPFGLVMPEALACGTPVIAFDEGSVREVIEHGVTGFIGQTEDDLLEGVNRLSEIDRRACRAEAERRFSPAAMASAYEAVYARLLEALPARLLASAAARAPGGLC